MWMDLTDTDLCTRQSHLWPRWATSRIDRCIVRRGTPPGSKLPRTARWRNTTRWWPPLQGKKWQEIVRLGYLYSCIFTLDWTRAFTGLGHYFWYLFYCLSRNDMFTSCFYCRRNRTVVLFPFPRGGKEISCQSSLASACWATDKYFHSAPGAARADDCSTAHTLHTLWCKWYICPIPEPELFIKLKQVCKYSSSTSNVNIVWEFRQLHAGNSWARLGHFHMWLEREIL